MNADTGESAPRVLAKQAPDGTFRARIFIQGRPVWECPHKHGVIEDAWDCGLHRARVIDLTTSSQRSPA